CGPRVRPLYATGIRNSLGSKGRNVMDQHGSPATGVRFAPLWLKRSRHVIDRVTQFLNVIGTLLIVAIMVLVNVDVIGRGAFDAPVAGVPELVSMSIVAIVFLQIA